MISDIRAIYQKSVTSKRIQRNSLQNCMAKFPFNIRLDGILQERISLYTLIIHNEISVFFQYLYKNVPKIILKILYRYSTITADISNEVIQEQFSLIYSMRYQRNSYRGNISNIYNGILSVVFILICPLRWYRVQFVCLNRCAGHC